MPTFTPNSNDFVHVTLQGKRRRLLLTEACNAFSTQVLGLGDLSRNATPREAIAAVFDLEGFTHFCKQQDPHLNVPLFLRNFLTWLIGRLKAEAIRKTYKSGVALWHALPFLMKFLGDGLLVLWDAATISPVAQRNVLVSASEICADYKLKFLTKIRKEVSDPPTALRCGLARGTIYSVGDGNDFVGPCINMAARLQKLPGISFAFNRRGFALEEKPTDFFKKDVVVKKVEIRGIGTNELVGILRHEFNKLIKSDRYLYRKP